MTFAFAGDVWPELAPTDNLLLVKQICRERFASF